MTDHPIGMFDSGVGGLSIWREIHALLPKESTIYLADSLHAPYGDRSRAEILRLSRKNTELLLKSSAKVIVVACNTATTNAIDDLRTEYAVPFIGIEPATKPAAISTRTKKIGILATKGTLASELFMTTSKAYRGDVEIIETIATALVPIIESGDLELARPLLKSYLEPMIEAGVDNIVLGCSHYPFLTEMIEELTPDGVRVLDSGAAVARHTHRTLKELKLEADSRNQPKSTFYTNGNLTALQGFLERIGARPEDAHQLDF